MSGQGEIVVSIWPWQAAGYLRDEWTVSFGYAPRNPLSFIFNWMFGQTASKPLAPAGAA